MLKTFPKFSQYDQIDCGPACVKIILDYYKIRNSFTKIKELSSISKEGTSFLDLNYAFKFYNCQTLGISAKIDDLVKIPLPSIIQWKDSHFIVLYKIIKNRAFISDPAKGLISYSLEEFQKSWYKGGENYGFILLVEKQPKEKDRDNEFLNKEGGRNSLLIFTKYFTYNKGALAQIILLMALVTALQGLLPFLAKAIIDKGISNNDFSLIQVIVAANITVYLGIGFSNYLRDRLTVNVSSRASFMMISDYISKLLALPMMFFESKIIGDIIQRASDHERIKSFLMSTLLNFIFSITTFLIFSLVLWNFSSQIFIIFLCGSLVYLIWIFLFNNIRKQHDWNYTEFNSINQSYWVETITGIQDLKISNGEINRKWKWQDIQNKLIKTSIRLQRVNNLQNQGASFINNIKNVFISYSSATLVIQGDITLGMLLAIQFIVGLLNGPITQLIGFVTSLQQARLSYQRITEIDTLEPEDSLKNINNLKLVDTEDLSFRNVSFQYNKTSPYVLKNINLNIPRNKITAIVGESGSGKSTLIRLLLKLNKPSSGVIKIGNIDLNNINTATWREKVGCVIQDGKLFNETIINNIALSGGEIDYVRLRTCCKLANINTFIESLPLAYETKIGENGKGLSGGQKQRLLIARALYNEPEFLFFDEATNSLDSINETEIIENIIKGNSDKTLVIVAHRLSTIKNADQIVVLKNGMLIEAGKHDELLSKKLEYYRVWQAQNK